MSVFTTPCRSTAHLLLFLLHGMPREASCHIPVSSGASGPAPDPLHWHLAPSSTPSWDSPSANPTPHGPSSPFLQLTLIQIACSPSPRPSPESRYAMRRPPHSARLSQKRKKKVEIAMSSLTNQTVSLQWRITDHHPGR
ncbi:hypothetical protein EV126DRAFT_17690 [Verticillium dahliae]|nr:hypothetical protein EV126DRAFT_17690 [Verticillium dahliae]